MNLFEAKRFAHLLVAEAISDYKPHEGLKKSPDWYKIEMGIAEILEQHLRFGPKSTDAEPRLPQPQDEPLPFDEAPI